MVFVMFFLFKEGFIAGWCQVIATFFEPSPFGNDNLSSSTKIFLKG